MINPITWLWNIRHKELIEEMKVIIRLHQFLRYEVGLKDADKLLVKEIKQLFIFPKRGKICLLHKIKQNDSR